MSQDQPASLTPQEVARLLSEKRKLWLGPTIACGVLGLLYALVAPRYWEASQALVVRQETAGGAGSAPGKFADLYEMRTLQETILEMAKSQQVVIATINAVDRRLQGHDGPAPTAEEIDKFRQRLKMLPPDGGEFGKSEIFYFYIKDKSRQRAIELVGELCRQLDAGLRQLRADRADSLIVELQEQAALAAETHAAETARLVEFETEVGADLGELRMLHSASSGQSDLRQETVMLEADVRRYQTQVRDAEQLLSLLQAARKDPLQLVATPNSLLTSQPGLRRLKDGLVDAQLATSRIAGTRTADHPRVQAAVEAEAEIRRDLHRELDAAVKGAEVELRLGRDRLTSTEAQLTDLQNRLAGLAERRGEYSNRVAAVDNSRVTLDKSRQNLSVAKAAQAAARSGSLVTRIDKPETGPHPAGLSRKAIAGAGAVSGLMLGLGLVFLSVPRPASPQTGGAEAEEPTGQNRGDESSVDVDPWWEELPRSTAVEAPTSAPAETAAELPQPAAADAAEQRLEAVEPEEAISAEAWRSEKAPQREPVASGGVALASSGIGDFSGMTLQQAMRAVGSGSDR